MGLAAGLGLSRVWSERAFLTYAGIWLGLGRKKICSSHVWFVLGWGWACVGRDRNCYELGRGQVWSESFQPARLRAGLAVWGCCYAGLGLGWLSCWAGGPEELGWLLNLWFTEFQGEQKHTSSLYLILQGLGCRVAAFKVCKGFRVWGQTIGRPRLGVLTVTISLFGACVFRSLTSGLGHAALQISGGFRADSGIIYLSCAQGILGGDVDHVPFCVVSWPLQ